MDALEQEFRFIRTLGEGAEGEVWLAEDLRRDHLLVAWKRLAGVETRLPEEFRLLQGLDHPSLNRVLDTGVLPGGGQWFTSVYFPGLPIDRLPTPLDPVLLEGVCHRACLALSALNDAGFRHGDLKPAHFLWSGPRPLHLELIDLGHATRLDAEHPEAVGTPPYAAPELWGKSPRPTRNTDLYALAMVALEVLRGNAVIESAALHDWRRWHESGDRDAALAGVRSDVSGALRDAIRACLSSDPADRPRDAAALAHRLRPWHHVDPGDTTHRPGSGAPLRGREDWLRATAGLLLGTRTSAEALILTGPAGVGRTRLMRALAGRVRAAGGIAVETEVAPDFHERARAAFSLEAPCRVLFVDDVRPEDLDLLCAGWRKLRAIPRAPACRLVLAPVSAPEGEGAVDGTRALATVAQPILIRPVPGLDRAAFGRLARDLDVPREDIDARWRASGGSPAALVAMHGGDRPAEVRAAVERTALGERWSRWLTEIPAPVPADVLAEALAIDAEELWRRFAAAGSAAPAMTGSGSMTRPTEAGVERPRFLPVPAPPTETPDPTLRALADAWCDADGTTGHWCALHLRARAGDPISPEEWESAFSDALRRDDAAAALTLAAIDPDETERPWRILEARNLAGETDAVRDQIPDDPDLLSAEHARISAAIIESTDGPAAALPFALRAVAASAETEHGTSTAEHAVARIRAARIAQECGDGETSRSLLADPIDEEAISPLPLLELGNVRMRGGDLEGSERAFRRALAGARGGVQPRVVLGVLSSLSGLSRLAGDGATAARRIERAIRYARRAHLEERNPSLAINQGAILHSLRRTDEALAAYERASRHLASFPDAILESHALLGLGTVLRDRGDLHPALIALRRALRRARECGAAPVIAAVLGNLGDIELLVGAPLRSRDHRAELLDLAERTAAPVLLRQARIATAAACVVTGELQRVDALLSLLSSSDRVGGPRLDAWEDRVRAERAAIDGDPETVLRSAAGALRNALRSGRAYTAAAAVRLIARAVALRGDTTRARALLTRGLELSRRDPCPPLSRIPLEIERTLLEPPSPRRERTRVHLAREALRIGLAEDFLTATAHPTGDLPEDLAEARADRLARLARRYGPAGIPLLDRRRGPVGIDAATAHGSAPPTGEPKTRRLRETVSLAESVPPGPSDLDAAPPGPASIRPLLIGTASLATGGRELQAGAAPRALEPLLEEWCRRLSADGARALVRPVRAWRPVLAVGTASSGARASVDPVDLPAPGTNGVIHVEEHAVGWALWLAWPGDPAPAVLFHGTGTWSSPPDSFDDRELAAAVLIQVHRRHAEIAESRLARAREEVRILRARERDERTDLETQALTQRLDRTERGRSTRSLGEVDGDAPRLEPPWIVVSPAMRELTARAARWHESDLPVLVRGESGVGKSALLDRFARTSRTPVITENCAALPEALLEAELFGFVPGAFTGAEREHPGLFARAAGGTVILDQLDELSPSLQAKMLRVLDSGRFRPLGSDTEVEARFRVIATLRDDPEDLIERNALRPELYYRLQGIEEWIPPLRERPEEIGPLLEAHLAHAARRLGRAVPSVGSPALARLRELPWPGNVRELVNLTQRWLIEGKSRITAKDVPDTADDGTRSPETSGTSEPQPAWRGEDWRSETDRFHRDLLTEALARFDGNQTHTAHALGISRRHLQNLLNKLGFREN